MEQEYLHVSTKPVDKLYDVKNQDSVDGKSNGLWFAKGYEWRDFLYDDGNLKYYDTLYIYRVKFDKKNLFKVKSAKDVIFITEIFKAGKHSVNWKEFAQEYDGILFNDYFKVKSEFKDKELKELNKWFFTIDIDSGCIWNVKTVQSFDLVETLNIEH